MITLGSSKMDFTGKVVLITGASSGIGAGIAKYFSGLGASLALTGRNLKNLKKVASECPAGTTPLLITGDLTIESDAKAILDRTVEHFGRLDVLVNNAGVLEYGSIETTSLDQYDNVMNTNVRPIFYLTSLAVPYLVKTEGNVVNMSSFVGLRSVPGIVAYSMSKAAIDHFTRCVALELAPKKVRVNCVNPGMIISDLQIRAGMTEEQFEAFLPVSEASHPLGRNGTPEEVGQAVAFLASDQAAFITGVTLPVDGGRQASST